MKLNYQTQSGRINVDFEGNTQVDLFSQIAEFQEVFDQVCGKCGSSNLLFVVRVVDENSYYELRCKDCGAKLAFGAHKKGGGLFPKRKDAEGKWLNHNGWTKWNPDTQTNE